MSIEPTTRMVVLPKNTREELRIGIDDFKGHILVSLRVWYRAGNGEMRPTKKGVSIQADGRPAVLNALQKLDETRRTGDVA